MLINQGNFERNYPRIISHFWDFSQSVSPSKSLYSIQLENIPPKFGRTSCSLETTHRFIDDIPTIHYNPSFPGKIGHQNHKILIFSMKVVGDFTTSHHRRVSGACSDEVERCWQLALLHHLQSSQNICYPTQKGRMSNCELGICMDSRNMLCTYPTCKRLKNDFALEILHRVRNIFTIAIACFIHWDTGER